MSEPEPDTLYEPALVVFVLGAWVVAGWLVHELLALGVFVAAAALLTVMALRRPGSDVFRTFLTDFGVILLFCAVAISIGVLALTGLS